MSIEKTLVLMVGVQGSGKSTFYARYLAEDFVRVNLDTLKTRNRERLLIEECLASGKSYAVDNTNPTRADRERYIPAARERGYRVIGYLMQTGIVPMKEEEPYVRGLSDYTLPKTAMDYLEKMRLLCEEKGSELILIKAPTNSWG